MGLYITHSFIIFSVNRISVFILCLEPCQKLGIQTEKGTEPSQEKQIYKQVNTFLFAII